MFHVLNYFKDFEGQARAERLGRIIITLFGIVGLIWGYIIQQFLQTVYILSAGFVFAALVSYEMSVVTVIILINL